MAKPIIKWVGGKTQILQSIKKEMPLEFNNFYELFFGGGALSFDLMLPNTIINDVNQEIIDMYNAIKENYLEVVRYIESYRKKYDMQPKDFYYKLRDYNEEFVKNRFANAAKTIFLNKTCFNGLFRLNSKGKFNVPWNQSLKAPNIYIIENLKEVSNYLNLIKINNYSFEKYRGVIKKNDFVYLDPPYDRISKTTFDSYNEDEFGKKGQIALKEFCDYLTEIGAKFLLSNHDTDFIKEIYKNYEIKIIKAARMVNSNGGKRGKINEVLIKNY